MRKVMYLLGVIGIVGCDKKSASTPATNTDTGEKVDLPGDEDEPDYVVSFTVVAGSPFSFLRDFRGSGESASLSVVGAPEGLTVELAWPDEREIRYCGELQAGVYEFTVTVFHISDGPTITETVGVVLTVNEATEAQTDNRVYCPCATPTSAEAVAALSECEAIVGPLTIVRADSTLTDLSDLAALKSVSEQLTIWDNDHLTDITGLHGLTEIGGDLSVTDNPVLCDSAIVTFIDLVDEYLQGDAWYASNDSGC